MASITFCTHNSIFFLGFFFAELNTGSLSVPFLFGQTAFGLILFLFYHNALLGVSFVYFRYRAFWIELEKVSIRFSPN